MIAGGDNAVKMLGLNAIDGVDEPRPFWNTGSHACPYWREILDWRRNQIACLQLEPTRAIVGIDGCPGKTKVALLMMEGLYVGSEERALPAGSYPRITAGGAQPFVRCVLLKIALRLQFRL